MRLQAVVDMRHLVLVAVGMRYLGLDRLVHQTDSHLLVVQSADMLDHWTVDKVRALDSGNLVFDLDMPE